MTQSLFSACKQGNQLTAKLVRLNASVQAQIEHIFDEQEQKFRDGIVNEVPFDGSWKPDEDEVLVIDVPSQAQLFIDCISVNASSLPDLNTASFLAEGVKAIFTGKLVSGAPKVLVQAFSSQQALEKKFALLQQGNSFRRITEPAFTLDTELSFIIEDGKIKFKKFSKLRTIINTFDIYKEATEQEVRDFAAHQFIDVADVSGFVGNTNQVLRRMIRGVSNSQVLDTVPVPQIQSAASNTNLSIQVSNGKIVLPTDKSELKEILRFLAECRYTGPLSGATYVTNSQRRV